MRYGTAADAYERHAPTGELGCRRPAKQMVWHSFWAFAEVVEDAGARNDHEVDPA
jgi:hypothetical protein